MPPSSPLPLHGRGPDAGAETPKQGGAAVVTFNNDLTTLDPQVGYDWQNWSVIKSIFDGLMDYKPGTTELEPDLAESYTVSDDGLTYTFKLRDGVKFHNGRPVTSADVKYSLERAVSPATQSPGGGYFSMIKGYDDLSAGKAKELSGIATPDDRTVVFTLTRPDATFLHLMAINFAYVVPKEEVEKARRRLGQEASRHRRLQIRRMGAGPAHRARAQHRISIARACPISTSSPSNSARIRPWRCCG